MTTGPRSCAWASAALDHSPQLLPGRRRMFLGLPLLAGLTVPRFQAVLAHEFGHYGNLDTRLGAITMRGRAAVLHTVRVFHRGRTRLEHLIGAVYGAYARMFLRSSQPVARRQEFDSHPPMAERIARIEALPDDGRADSRTDELTALTLLRDPDRVCTELEERLLPPETAQLRRLPWDELVRLRALADAEGWSRPLRVAVARSLRTEAGGRAGGALVTDEELPGLTDVLDSIDRGLLWTEIALRMPKPDQASRLTGDSARNFIRPKLFDGLAGLVHLHLAEAGHAGWDIAWSGVPGISLPDAWEAGFDDALDAAVADTPDTTALRALLATTGQVPAPQR